MVEENWKARAPVRDSSIWGAWTVELFWDTHTLLLSLTFLQRNLHPNSKDTKAQLLERVKANMRTPRSWTVLVWLMGRRSECCQHWYLCKLLPSSFIRLRMPFSSLVPRFNRDVSDVHESFNDTNNKRSTSPYSEARSNTSRSRKFFSYFATAIPRSIEYILLDVRTLRCVQCMFAAFPSPVPLLEYITLPILWWNRNKLQIKDAMPLYISKRSNDQ